MKNVISKIACITTVATLAGCSSNPAPPPQPFDWKRFVIPIENSEFKTDVQSPDESRANEVALKAAYGACEPGRPVILERTTTRSGLMGETTAAVYEVAHQAANLLGHWSPGINDEEYSAEWRFKCESI